MKIDELRNRARSFLESVDTEDGEGLGIEGGIHFNFDEGIVFLCNLKSFLEGRGESAVGITPVFASLQTGECRFLTLDESLSLSEKGQLVLE
ncbi:hypothetical protein [Streptomyces sp. GESEQ-4]|uniref:hypothetical protein n=1 Tax=Streptomyces sp. GESEQ-4 TaxID=2812655 RepID=UPI001B33ECDE|nr:hypothetical protein [Streptomyces sp. GESEQ-4]